MPRARSWLVLVAVLAFTALIVGLPAGQAPLWDPNEARYMLLLPWYGTYLTAHAPAFVGDTVVGHYGSWVFRRGLLTRLESLWLVVYALPWTIFVIGAIAWRQRAPDAERQLIAVWTLAIWALTALGKRHLGM